MFPASAVLAQDQSPEIARVYLVEGKPGFEQALRHHMEMRREMEDPWEWTALEVVNGQRLGTYVIRTGEHRWSDLDRYEAEFEPKAGPHFAATVLPSIERAESRITWTDAGRSRFPTDWSKISLVQVMSFDVKPGMEQQIDEAVAAYHQAITERDAPVYYAWDHLVNGSGAPRSLAIFHESWADMAPKGVDALVTDVHGEEKAAEIERAFNESPVPRGSGSDVGLRIHPRNVGDRPAASR